MNKLLAAIIIAAVVYFGYGRFYANSAVGQDTEFGAETSNTQVRGSGVVTRILPDDNQGSRHQRFILELPSGQTVLVAHNIDLAPRISGLKQGDAVEFNGEFEWNSKGGVVHWTHRDPANRHAAGWLKSNGRTFQ